MELLGSSCHRLALCASLSVAACASTNHPDAAAPDGSSHADAAPSDARLDASDPRDGTPALDALDAPAPPDAPARDALQDARDAALDAPADSPADAAPDPFGVRRIYPTASGGREWYLPADAGHRGADWYPETDDVTQLSPGVFHTIGDAGEVRLDVTSPAGTAWWRNVEMTGYFRYTGDQPLNGQRRHFELFARGERHSESPVTASQINSGVPAPAGTATWPGYPFAGAMPDVHCLGTAYHGNFYPVDQDALFEKEVSHSDGYADQREDSPVTFATPLDRWFGIKFVARNDAAATRVHLELWLDASADGTWTRVIQTDDTAGSWSVPAGTSLDGCDAPPSNYSRSQLMTWAGPWVTFRSDAMAIDFKQLSVREIAPLP